MTNGDAHYIFYAISHDGLVVARIEFSKTAAGYQLRAGALTDASSSSYTDFSTTTTISGTAFHKVEIEWKAATAPGANNGVLTLWVDGTQANTLTNLDNDTRRVDGAQLGPVYGIDTGTRGTEYFDAFISRRNTYIGYEQPGGMELAGLDEPAVQPQPYGGSKVLAELVPLKKVFIPELNPQLDSLVGTSITYTYDPLNRLTGASYSDGTYYNYTYDAVGNRLTETTPQGTTNYVYDAANRLTSVGGVSYTWDNNGNLLSDGTSTYTYDHANRLKSVVQGANTYTYFYISPGCNFRAQHAHIRDI
jgi:YD repeat-containing protein